MISIIITAYKEEATIGKAIESIVKQKINEKYELIISAPDEGTLNIAKSYTKKFKQIKIIKDSHKGKPAALNLVFSKAKGKILILTDGDVYVGKNAIKEILEKFKDKNVGAVSGRPVSLNSRDNMLGFWSHLLTDTAHKIRAKRVKEGKMIVCSGYLYAIRSEIVGKIPEDALSEDAVISHLICEKGYQTAYSPGAEVYIKYPTNFSDWIKQKKRSAGGYNQLSCFVKGKERMRCFTKESAGIFQVLAYPKTLKELFWTLELIGSRLYLWFLIYKEINLKIGKNKIFGKHGWERVESTK